MDRQRGRPPRILLINPPRDYSQVGADRFERNAPAHPSQQRQPAGVVFLEQIAVRLQRLLHRHRRPKFAGPGIESATLIQ